MIKHAFITLFASGLALMFVTPVTLAAGASNQIQKGEMAGYLLVPNEKVPETYDAGFSMYVAAWPLLDQHTRAAVHYRRRPQTFLAFRSLRRAVEQFPLTPGHRD
jgi:hypothetical protein